jgi:alkylation response protein AidB-like acyl-CoA dehydrogenase
VFSPGVIGSIMARHGTPEQNDRWLRGIATGKGMASFAITEPDAGTNSNNIKTYARKDGDRWILNGQKYYVSGMEDADVVMVVARTGEKEGGRGRLSLFMVDADAPGLSRQVIETGMNIPEHQWTLYFDDVEVDRDRLIGEEHHGFKAMFDGLNPERILVGGVCTGVGLYALDRAVSYARERKVWDVPIGAHQGVSHPLARAKLEIEHARLMTQKAARLFDLGFDAGEASNMGKLLSAESGLHALDRAIQTHGGNGVAKEYQLTDYWFLVRMLKIGPVSEEMILNHIAERTLGLPKSY